MTYKSKLHNLVTQTTVNGALKYFLFFNVSVYKLLVTGHIPVSTTRTYTIYQDTYKLPGHIQTTRSHTNYQDT